MESKESNTQDLRGFFQNAPPKDEHAWLQSCIPDTREPGKTDRAGPIAAYLRLWNDRFQLLSRDDRDKTLYLDHGLARREGVLAGPSRGFSVPDSEWYQRNARQIVVSRRHPPPFQEGGDHDATAGDAKAEEAQVPGPEGTQTGPATNEYAVACTPQGPLSAKEVSLVEYLVTEIFHSFTTQFQSHGNSERPSASADLSNSRLAPQHGDHTRKRKRIKKGGGQQDHPDDELPERQPPSDPSSGPSSICKEELPKFGCQVLKGRQLDPKSHQKCLKGWSKINRLKVYLPPPLMVR
jgi:hypothetical protein